MASFPNGNNWSSMSSMSNMNNMNNMGSMGGSMTSMGMGGSMNPASSMNSWASKGVGKGWQLPSPGSQKKMALVQRVKDIQKRGELQKQAWYTYCIENGSTDFDPERYDEIVLQEFCKRADALGGGGQSKGGSKGSSSSAWGSADDWGGWDGGWWDSMMGGDGMWDMMMNMMWNIGVQKGSKGGKGGKSGKGGKDGASGMGGGGGGMKPGDWICPACGDLVFASRDQCKMCACPKPQDAGKGAMCGACGMGGMGGMGCMGMGGKGGKGGKGGGGKGDPSMDPTLFGGKPGDWICPGCWNVNFSHRDKCNSCGMAGRTESRLGMKPGDWICPTCGDLVFASKDMCKLCATPKPEDASAGVALGGEMENSFFGAKGGGKASFRASPY